MKAPALILLFVFCSVECRKVVPINKHANIDFINMESGGARQPAVQPPPKQTAPAAAPAPVAPAPTTKAPIPAPTAKPAAAPLPTPSKPAQPAAFTPTQIKPVPMIPSPGVNPITTPGPGSVKSLVNYYNSQGNGSLIRPYTYSQAVKQG